MDEPTPSLEPAVVLAHEGWVRHVARSLLVDEHEVDDAVQETWLAALQAPPRHSKAWPNWLATVVRGRAASQSRSAGRRTRREHVAATPEALPSAAEMLEQASVRRAVVDAVLALEEPYRSTVLWRYFEELTPSEIASRSGEPASTVRSRLTRALSQIRARLDAANAGRRAAWLGALAVLASGGTAHAAASAVLGGIVVGKSKLIAIATVGLLLAAGVGWWALEAPGARSGDTPLSLLEAAAPPATSPRAPLPTTTPARPATPPGAAPVAPAADPATADAPAAARPDRVTHRGIVVDQKERPIPGASVWFLEQREWKARRPEPATIQSRRAQAAVRTDAAGRFILRVPADQPGALLATHPYHVGIGEHELAADDVDREIRIRLDGGAAGGVRVTVEPVPGEPLDTVALLMPRTAGHPLLDRETFASTWDTGTLAPGRWTLMLYHRGAWRPSRHDFEVRPGCMTSLSVRPEPAVPFEGQLVRPDGVAVADAPVTLRWVWPGEKPQYPKVSHGVRPDLRRHVTLQNGACASEAVTDAEGRFRFPSVPSFPLTLTFRYQGEFRSEKGLQAGTFARIVVPHVPPQFVLEFPPETRGLPIVELFGESGRQQVPLDDRPDGAPRRASIGGLAAGHYVVWARSYENAGQLGQLLEVEVREGDVQHLVLDPRPTAQLSFTVRLRGDRAPGTGVARPTGYLYWAGRRLYQLTIGSRETVPAGERLVLRIDCDGYVPHEEPVLLSPNETRTLGTFELVAK